jgi:hypothetical protein
MPNRLLKFLKGKTTHKIASSVALVLVLVMTVLILLENSIPKYSNVFVIGSGLILAGFSIFIGWIFVVRREIPYTEKHIIAKGEIAVTLGKIAIISGVALLVLIFFSVFR